MASNVRGILAVVTVVAVAAVLGGTYGRGLGSAALVRQKDAVKHYTREFEDLVTLLRQNYSSEIDVESIIYRGAIPSMLLELDPHSQFLDPRAFARLREDQKGSYAGVGMQIVEFRGRTVVDFPFPNTPSFSWRHSARGRDCRRRRSLDKQPISRRSGSARPWTEGIGCPSWPETSRCG